MDPEDGIERFLKAQKNVYLEALNEIRNGKKESHWMWFVFPQIRGLGFTDFNVYYGLKDLNEAQQYIAHPILGKRLLEITEAVYCLKGKTAFEIFGRPDERKLKSCMTLFGQIQNSDPLFQKVLDMYYQGLSDEKTIAILVLQNKLKQ